MNNDQIESINQILGNALSVRFAVFHFYLQIVENTQLPKDKTSAFRGGIGEMLLRMNCISNRKCMECDFESDCLVRKIMYSKLKRDSKFSSDGESLGYIMCCNNTKETFYFGDEIRLDITLFGNNIVYFSQYVQALSLLGIQGVGKSESKFVIKSITNSFNQDILVSNEIMLNNIKIQTLNEYAMYRYTNYYLKDDFQNKISFISPTTIKYKGEILEIFDLNAIMDSLKRRIHLLDCFEGIEVEKELYEIQVDIPYVIMKQNNIRCEVHRYSNSKRQKMSLRGIEGWIEFEEKDKTSSEEKRFVMLLLFAGEIIGIGKNTSFGFGKYRIK